MRRVVVRCDAGPSVGVGHVMRCVALAEAFARRGASVTFVADLDAVPWARSHVRRRGFDHYPPPPTHNEEAARIASLDPSLVVVDSYVLPAWAYGELRRGEAAVLALVDGDPGERDADVFLDQNVGAEGDDWQLPAEARRLAGLDYALLRDDVIAHRPSRPRTEDAAVPSVLAFFGGTDPFGAAPVVARLLVATGLPFDSTFVGARPELRHELERIEPGRGQRLVVVPLVEDLPGRVERADVVLSAAGTSSWELLCLGAAAGLVCVADNQEQSYERVVAQGLAIGLGRLADLRQGTGARTVDLARLLSSPHDRSVLRQRGWGRVDGLGRERVVDLCEDL